ncbi:MAG: SpvB/TcaC N-terminal domain-containing protein, partial [Candidatus Falkowbacteria bacterium]
MRSNKSSLKTAGVYFVLAVFIFTNFLPLRAWAEDSDVVVSQPTMESVATTDVIAPTISDQPATEALTENPAESTSVLESIISAPGEAVLKADDITPVDDNIVLPDKRVKDVELPTQQKSLMSLPAASTRGSASQPVTSKSLKLEPNQNNGALVFVYPLTVVPGRNGLQPDLKLSYNSQQKDDDNVFGHGWSLNIPYIERINKKGTDQLYTQDYFSSSLSGELASTSAGIYAAKFENGDFLNYSFSNNQWLVKDKSGKQYKFGYASGSRLDDPNNSDNVYRWLLEEVRDTNNNYIKYTYYKDGDQIYPSQITYTGHDTSDGIFTVNFERSSRTDVNKNYKSAFLVTTNYRISEINVAINSSWVRKYSLDYTTGDNSYRSLLSGITESARDGDLNETTIPATTFDYQNSTASWTHSDNTYSLPAASDGKQSAFVDVSGDGLPDVLQSYENATSTYKDTWEKSTSSNWALNSNLEPPTLISKLETRDGSQTDLWDQGTRLADVNGDQRPDSIQGLDGYQGTGTYVSYLNSTSTGFVQNYDWVSPVGLTQAPDGSGNGGSVEDYGAVITDLNGDGLADITRQWSGNYQDTYLNTGSGFATSTSAWNTSVDLRFPWTQSADLNSDGLPDLIYSYWNDNLSSYDEYSYLNSGNGVWATSSEFVTPKNFVDSSNTDSGVRFMDINGDDLPDAVWDSTSADRSWINTGSGWSENTSWTLPFTAGDLVDEKIFVGDINGDGLVDFIKGYNCEPGSNCQNTDVYIHDGVVPDLLSSVTYPQGGSSAIAYQKSAQYKDVNDNLLNPQLPLLIDTVSLIADNDGLGQMATTTYAYSGGNYYFNNSSNRQFAGFEKIVKTRPDGTTETSYYHQGNDSATSTYEFDDQYAKIGKAYQVDNNNASGILYQRTVTKWQTANLSTDHYFSYPTQIISQQYDGGSNHADTATTYVYDDYSGNVLEQYEWGTVTTTDPFNFTDIGTDNRSTFYTYINNPQNDVTVLSLVMLLDNGSNDSKKTRYYYDNLSYGEVSEGNNTKTENWAGGRSYISSSKTYNDYGLITSETDPRNYVTSYDYDSYNLYPIIVTKPLNMVSSYAYDYTSGQPIQITDENNQIFKYTYDGFGRLLTEQIPNEYHFREIINTPLYDDPALNSYYQLEYSVIDSKGDCNGKGRSLTYSTSTGKFGKGASFNGIDSRIAFSDSMNMVDWNSTLTLNMWVKPTGSGALFSKYGSTEWNMLSRLNYEDGIVTWDYQKEYSWSRLSTPVNSLIIGDWNMITFTRDDNGMRRIYVNGMEKASGGAGWVQSTANSSLYFGVFYDGDLNNFPGYRPGTPYTGSREFLPAQMDDLSFFGRTLSGSEISDLYNGDLASSTATLLDTGFIEPTNDIYSYNWDNASNAYEEDNNFATTVISSSGNSQAYNGFDFNLPLEWVNIIGVEARIKARVDSNIENNLKVHTYGLTARSITLNTESTWYTVGGPNDLAADYLRVSDNFFGMNPSISLTAEGATDTIFYVDAIEFKIYYTVSVGHDSEFKIPTGTGTYGNDWSDPAYGYQEDGNSAYVELNDYDIAFQSYENFNLDIPATSTISGIQILVNGHFSYDYYNQIGLEINSTNNGGRQLVLGYLGSDCTSTQKFGNYGELFGEEWSPDDFNDNKFYIKISAENSGNTIMYYLDSVGVKIYYTFPDENPNPVAPTTTPFTTKRSITYNDTPNLSSNQLAYSHVSSSNPDTDEYILYDGLGRPVRSIKSQDDGVLYADTEYDSSSRVSRQSVPYEQSNFSSVYGGYGASAGITTTYGYDALGRSTTISDTNGTTTNIYNGNMMTVIDSESNSKSYERDGLNRLIEVIENNQNNTYHTYYDWDAQDNLIKITDAENNERNFIYDSLGRRTFADDLHNPSDQTYGSYSYEYDESNNLIAVSTPNNDTIIYDYDALNRQTSERLINDSQPRISYDYDGCVNGQGKLCAATRDDGPEYSYTYTNNGQVATEAVTINNWYKTTAYQYDRQGNITKITLPDNSEVRYNYAEGNPYNQPTSITWKTALATSTTPIVSNITYNEAGQPETIEYANSRTSEYGYDNNHKYRLSNITTDASSGNYQDVNYTWTPAGNLSSISETGNAGLARNVDYSYDNLYRLTESIATASSTTIYDRTMTYSPTGNILSKSDQGSYTYSSINSTNPQAVTQIGTSTLSYDNNGNLLDYNSDSYEWNYRNEMMETVIGTA